MYCKLNKLLDLLSSSVKFLGFFNFLNETQECCVRSLVLDFTIALLSLKSEIPTVLTKYFSFDSQLLSNEGAKRKATAEVQKHKFKTFSMAKSWPMSREVSLRLEIQKHLRGDILH